MNPEDNNPLTNSGIPDLGMSATPTDMATPMSPDLSGITGVAPDAAPLENPFAPAVEEPLVPAAPVPGSIGSVTSVPADATTPAPTTEPLAPAPSNPFEPAAPSMPAQQPPYNPFAQPAPAVNNNDQPQPAAPAAAPAAETAVATTPNPAPAAAPTSAPTMAPPVQPTIAPKAKKVAGSGPLMIVFAIVAVIGVIAAIVFAILYFNASNSPKVVYVPSISEDTNNETMQILTCTKQSDFNYLIGYDHEVLGNVAIVADYTNDKLSSLEFDYDATFDSEGDASVASDNFAASFNTQDALVGTQSVEGNTMKSTYNLIDGMDLTDSIAQSLIYGEDAAGQDLSISGVEAHYTASGFSCSVE